MVTGSEGFLGKSLCNTLVQKKYNISKVSRFLVDNKEANLDLENYINWKPHLSDIDILIHTAGRVHIKKDSNKENFDLYKKINVEATINLANQAAMCGVKRFIFISSIKVVGEKSIVNKPFNESNFLESTDPYAKSKIEAEEALVKISKKSNMDIVIIRPPLVYGPDVRGNFLSLMQWLYRGIPLPLKAVRNLRSFISLYNLIDFIILCIEHPKARNETFFVSDDEDVSVVDLIVKISKVMNKSVNLVYIPIIILKFFSIFLAKRDAVNKLTDSLQINISKAKSFLNWKPIINCDKAIELTVNHYLSFKKNK